MTASVKIEGSELVIRLPLSANPSPSASGKTLVVASTHGNMTSAAEVNGKPVTGFGDGRHYRTCASWKDRPCTCNQVRLSAESVM